MILQNEIDVVHRGLWRGTEDIADSISGRDLHFKLDAENPAVALRRAFEPCELAAQILLFFFFQTLSFFY